MEAVAASAEAPAARTRTKTGATAPAEAGKKMAAAAAAGGLPQVGIADILLGDHRDTVTLLKKFEEVGPIVFARGCCLPMCSLQAPLLVSTPSCCHALGWEVELSSEKLMPHLPAVKSCRPLKPGRSTLLPSNTQVEGSGDKLLLEKLTDAIAITIRLHSQVGRPAGGCSAAVVLGWVRGSC